MSAVVRLADNPGSSTSARIALLGTGVVGSAFIDRYLRLLDNGIRLPGIAWLANSRALQPVEGDVAQALREANAAPRLDSPGLPHWAQNESLRAGDTVIDATASDVVADWHAQWLARGIHVVTANKLGNGSSWLRAQDIQQQADAGQSRYGDSATVGAGLPLLRSIRALVAGGDRIHAVEGVLSGSLAWLFNHYDGRRPFSELVREASQAGYTEPDPRIDLSGEDVRRKLLILARAAGLPLQSHEVRVKSLVPDALASLPLAQVDTALGQLDAPIAELWQRAAREGGQLRFVGRFDAHGASVGVRVLPAGHALCGGSGTDNRVAISSDRYLQQPLLVQGPGAGAGVTAAALLDDVIAITQRA
ncbi:homoserine dehydrogenase [Pseudoxanthomonas dokdonensis]|uniref:Homoserine dehydrogenase n=1 Tax=Pseudoxanthomonas dokdonensis TaxID=344882 RepID=A0A0R0CVK6_9GAMM|nr:homoserine dehydrogenase [Pseudoxanthomonas dokdonensis]KRG70151.1 homoserine dehydrogenase [Pseudoxanthomonas dokdonensis]